MTAFVILADEADGAAASRLAAMGHAVRAARDVTRAQLAAARKVIVVWSRTARGTPALRAAARRAKAHGKLVCVRLDAALPPAELGGARAKLLPAGRAQSAAWRKLLRPVVRATAQPVALTHAPVTTRRAVRRAPAPIAAAAVSSRHSPRLLASLAALTLIVFATGMEAYRRDADFAVRVQSLASTAQAAASELVAEIAP